jgi:hypothetical protein
MMKGEIYTCQIEPDDHLEVRVLESSELCLRIRNTDLPADAIIYLSESQAATLVAQIKSGLGI